MYFTYDGIKVFYKKKGKGEKTLVFLHGWGAEQGCFLPFEFCFENEYSLLFIDFPPFGKSEEPKSVWGVEDYSEMVKSLVEYLKIKELIFVAHSFGCRVAIKFSSCYTNLVKALVLIGAAGCKPKRGLKYYFKVLKYKLSKKKNIRAGSSDYVALSPHMKKCFVKIVNTFQEPEMKTLVVPTLLIFGENDNDTPLYMAKRMKKLIKNSKLVIVKNSSHFCFLEQFDLVFDSVYSFLKECE